MVKQGIPGFGLLGAAMALSVLGGILLIGLRLFAVWSQYHSSLTTQTHQEIVARALGAYVLRYGYLPCPAPKQALGGQDGVEAREGIQCRIREGGIPYRTLGLPSAVACDGAKEWMLYVPEPVLCQPASVPGFESLPGATPDEGLCAASSTPPQLKIWREREGMRESVVIGQNAEANRIAFILIASDCRGRKILSNTPVIDSPGEQENLDGDDEFVCEARAPFAHRVYWVTRDLFVARYLGGACKTKNVSASPVREKEDVIMRKLSLREKEKKETAQSRQYF